MKYLLVSDRKNIFYLTSFMGMAESGRDSMALAKVKDGKVGDESVTETVLIVPRMNESMVEYDNVEIMKEGERYSDVIKRHIGEAEELMMEEYDLTVEEKEKLEEKLGVRLVSSERFLTKKRLIKSEKEIEMIKKAVELTDKAYSKLVEFLAESDRAALTELDVVDELNKIQRGLGGEGFGFPPIVAFGSHSATPHHMSGNRKLVGEAMPAGRQDVLLIDMGVKYKSYTGDLTRCIYLGTEDSIPDQVQEIYELVHDCNKLCIQAVRPGVTFNSIHKIAVDFFKKHKLDKYFIHSIGHGVGLDVHEMPYARSSEETVLEAGMVITIEPGLYFPGGFEGSKPFGIRIEDMLVVRKNPGQGAQGFEILSNSPKDFTQLPRLQDH